MTGDLEARLERSMYFAKNGPLFIDVKKGWMAPGGGGE